MTGLFHSAWFQGSSLLWRKVELHSFLFLNNVSPCGYTTFCLLGRVGCFCFLAVMNDVTVNICEQIFIWIKFLLLLYSMELLGPVVILWPFRSGCAVLSAPQQTVPISLHLPPLLCLSYVSAFHQGLGFHFPNVWWYWAIFHVLIGHRMSSSTNICSDPLGCHFILSCQSF